MLPKDECKIVTQIKFIAWESQNKLKLVAIDADPPIEKIIQFKLYNENLEDYKDERSWFQK